MNPEKVPASRILDTANHIGYAASLIRQEWYLRSAPGYPTRQTIPLHCKDWKRPFVSYSPPEYTAPSVLRNALGPPDRRYADDANITKKQFQDMVKSGQIKSFEGPIMLDPVSGRPLNPSGRTGISGRGGWGKWGPNHAADTMLVRENALTNKLEILLILRKTGEWALPGGMLNPGETGSQAAIRELREETSVAIPSLNPWLVFEGAVRLDPRDTDNAWAETTLAMAFLGQEGMKIQPKANDDARQSEWFEISEKLLTSLYSNHGSLIRMGIKRLKNELPSDKFARYGSQISFLAHDPLLTTFSGMKGTIGIFGGTFDPLHEGHIKLVEAAQRWHKIDNIVFIPVAQNPLKDTMPTASSLERLMMIREALADNPSWHVSPIQLRHPTLTYTSELLRAIRQEVGPSVKLFTLVGADCISTFDKWHNIDGIRAQSTIVPVLRAGSNIGAALSGLSPTFCSELTQTLVPATIPPYAGTALRLQLSDGRVTPPGALPLSVQNFVEAFTPYQA